MFCTVHPDGTELHPPITRGRPAVAPCGRTASPPAWHRLSTTDINPFDSHVPEIGASKVNPFFPAVFSGTVVVVAEVMVVNVAEVVVVVVKVLVVDARVEFGGCFASRVQISCSR